MASVVNFGAGPAKLPEEVLVKVQNELIHYAHTKISIMEMSHRSKEYMQINNECQQLIREILDVPSNYKVIFMQGGGTGMFAAVPMNLISKTGVADYVVTGSWSSKAVKEASKYGKINMVVPKVDKYTGIPKVSEWKLDPKASYVHICYNETIEGIEFQEIPDVGDVPLVADMSSDIMTRKLDISKFGIIYAGAQKNIGPAGVTLVIIRDDLLNHAIPQTPAVLDFALNAKENSLYNTPPCFSIYVMNLVFKWIKNHGGIKGMEDNAIEKSNILYNIIDNSDGFYSNVVDPSVRSRMNVTFRITSDKNLDELFIKGAESNGYLQIKGHRSVGGFRASVYNAVSVENVKSFGKYMMEFSKNHRQ